MEREEMIEEMANDIPAEIKDPYQGSNITVLYSYQRREQIAKCLVYQNYRKIPEGAVVLTQEMAYEYREDLAKVKYLKDEIRKETAKEILQELYDTMKPRAFSAEYQIKTLAEKYGVEVEE